MSVFQQAHTSILNLTISLGSSKHPAGKRNLHLFNTMKAFNFLLATCHAAIVSAIRGPQVDLGYSTYEGLTYDNGVNAFLGMRYAAAPIGNNRLRLPQDPKNETGVVSAKEVCL